MTAVTTDKATQHYEDLVTEFCRRAFLEQDWDQNRIWSGLTG